MTVINRTLSEGIAHIEDLPIGEFIDVLRNLGSMTGQEKLDGANLWLGLDENGKFFTSREGKRSSAERRYSATEWPNVSAYNQFRAAHTALEQVTQEIQTVLAAGDTIEAEVLFGNQPNAVQYGLGGKSYIAFLRGVADTPDMKADQLATTLANRQVEASVDLVDTTDGRELSQSHQTLTFQFVTPQKIDSAELETAPVEKEIKKLEAFLKRKSPIAGMSNEELLMAQLGSVDKDQRAAVKDARAALLATVQADFKLPIKNSLLDNVVRKLKSGFTATDLPDNEDIGVEGVVLRDPQTGKQVKIVDKDVFTTINKFNQAVRGQIQSNLMTTDPDATLEARGGIVGALRIKIAELLGNRELAKNANVRKLLKTMKGATPEESIKNLAKTMPELNDYQSIKRKVLALVQQTYRDIDTKLNEFKEQKDEYQLKLKNGKTMGLSDDTVKKTLLSFAEARRNTADLFDRVKTTNSLSQLLAIMYGAAARTVHTEEDVAENLNEKAVSTQKWKAPTKKHVKIVKPKIKKPVVAAENGLSNYSHKDTVALVSSYLATVFMSMVLIHEGDSLGIKKLRDRKGAALKSWSLEMSPLNFWGYGVWQPNKSDVKAELDKKTHSDLVRVVGKIPVQWWKFLHMDLSYDKEVKIDWSDHQRTLTRLIELTGVRSERLNTLLNNTVRWPELTYDEKILTINKLYFLAQQYVPKSSLFARIRVIQSNMLLNPTGKNPQMIESKLLKQVAALVEADSSSAGSDPAPGGSDGGESSSSMGNPVSSATTAADMNITPTRNKMLNKTIVKRKRNPVVKALTLKFPDPRKKNETH